MDNKNEAIVVRESFDCSVETLWKAITEYSQLKQWFFEEVPSFQAEIGYLTEFVIRNEDRTFSHQITVIEVIHYRLMVQQWQFEEYPGKGHVIYEVEKDGDGATLQLTSKVIDPFPSDIPEFDRESGVGGWNYFIKERLKGYIEGEKS